MSLVHGVTRRRHPVGASILDGSRAQVALMRPTPSTRALAAVIRDLIETGDGATYFAERVWGVSLRHDLGVVIRWQDAALLILSSSMERRSVVFCGEGKVFSSSSARADRFKGS
jgi:hypothetical protein